MYSRQGICFLLAELVYVVHYKSCFVYGPLPRIDIFDSRPCVEISTQNWVLQAHPQPTRGFGYATRIGFNPRSISWGFSTSVDSGCLNLLVALVSSSWAHGRYSYNPPSFRDRKYPRMLCALAAMSNLYHMYPHVISCYIIKCCFRQLGITWYYCI
jgi:hypothetical protein